MNRNLSEVGLPCSLFELDVLVNADKIRVKHFNIIIYIPFSELL